jgi:hypothetical protein
MVTHKNQLHNGCIIAEVQPFLASKGSSATVILVRNSANDSAVRNLAELRTKIADAHLWQHADFNLTEVHTVNL